MAEQKIKARYRVTGPKREVVSQNMCIIDDTGSMIQKIVSTEMDTYMVFFPQGHSIRVLGFDALKALGFHLKPRMVDMNTGDVVDVGGDPYDFSDATSVSLEDEDLKPAKSKAAA